MITNPQVAALLGTIPLYNDLRGNFAHAALVAEEALRANPTPQTLIDRAIVHLLQGEIQAALMILDKASELSATNPDHQYRVLMHQFAAMVMKLAWYPTGCDISSHDVNVYGEHFLLKIFVEYQKQKQSLSDQNISTEAKFAEKAFKILFYTPLAGRNVNTGARLSKVKDLVDAAKHFLPTGFREEAQQAGQTVLTAFADRVSAELLWHAGIYEESIRTMQSAAELYRTIGDTVGEATCKMLLADGLCAPFSSPEFLNFALREATSGDGSLSYEVEAHEFTRPHPEKVTMAHKIYSEVEVIFTKSGATRGVAAVQLRYGYLEFLNHQYEEAVTHAERALLFSRTAGDTYTAKLSEIHTSLYRIASGHRPEPLDLAETIGRWGNQEGSYSYSLGLGILVVRFAYHLLSREGDYEGSLAAFRLAARLFAVLDAPLNYGYTLKQQARVYEIVGDFATSLVLLEQAADENESALRRFAQMKDHLKVQLGWVISELYNLYVGEKDTKGMRITYERVQRNLADLQQAPKPKDVDELSAALAEVSWMSTLAVTSSSRVLIPLYEAERARDEGDAEKAEALFAEAEAEADQAEPEVRLNMLAVVYGTQKKYGEALAATAAYVNSEAPGWRGGLNGHLATLRAVIASPSSNSMNAQLMKVVTGIGAPVMRAVMERTMRRQALTVGFTVSVRSKGWRQAKAYADALERLEGDAWWSQEKQPWDYLGDLGALYEGLKDASRALHYFDKGLARFLSSGAIL